MNFLITGGTGFIGKSLCSNLLKNGHSIVVKTRYPESFSQNLKEVSNLNDINADVFFDVVINLAGEPIADKNWSDIQKKKIENSRLESTRELIQYFQRAKKKPSLFISGSAIGYYGIEITNHITDENNAGDNSFSSKLCKEWEDCALQAESLGIRTCLLRTGIVLGKKGGALAKMLPPFKFGLGGKIGSGKQWMPWIHLDDMIGIINAVINDENLQGSINCTAPNPVTNLEFSKVLGKSLNRPAIFPMPAFVVKLLFGEMGEELLLSGKKVIPSKLEKAGYQFKYEHLDAALADIV